MGEIDDALRNPSPREMYAGNIYAYTCLHHSARARARLDAN